MNNNIWLSISFSVLLATINDSSTQPSNNSTFENIKETQSIVSNLNTNKIPSFKDSSPCYAQVINKN